MRKLLNRLARTPEAPLLQGTALVKLPPSAIVLRVLVFCRDGQFLAQGIEFDINAQAPTEKQAVQSYLRIVRARAKYDIAQGRDPLAGVPAAPKQYRDVWDRLEQRHRDDRESLPADPADDLLGNQLPAWVIHALANNGSDLGLNR